MANYRTLISKHVFGKFVRLGSKQLLESPVLGGALVCGTFSRPRFYQQCSNPPSNYVAHLGSNKPHPPSNYGQVRQFLHHLWKLGFSGSMTKLGYIVSDLETIPYSKRTRWALLPRLVAEAARDGNWDENEWEAYKEENKDKILASNHPKSVRVRSITNKVIDALERGLRDDKVWGGGLSAWKHALNKAKALVFMESPQSVNKSRATRYLNHIDRWEFLVVDDPKINARCTLGGKIVVHTGLLEHFGSDAEIASIVAHEVGHVVALHIEERLGRAVLLLLLGIPRLLVSNRRIHNAALEIGTHPLLLSLSRKQELEADYIGLLLMASAGYHPRIALKVHKKLAKLRRGNKIVSESKSTHPYIKRRLRLVAQAQDEAMALYKETLLLLEAKSKTAN